MIQYEDALKLVLAYLPEFYILVETQLWLEDKHESG